MAETGPYVFFVVLVAAVCSAVIIAAVEAYRKDLMAKGRLALTVVMMFFIFGLVAFFLFYVLGPAATSASPGR